MIDQREKPGVRLDHTIVYARDRAVSAAFLAGILGLEVGPPAGPFVPVVLGDGLTLDYLTFTGEAVQSQHYAFHVPAKEFDTMIARLERSGITYFADPDGHNMEILTYSVPGGAS